MIVDDGNSAGRVVDLDSQGCGVFDSQAIFSQAQRAKKASSWFTESWMVFTPLQDVQFQKGGKNQTNVQRCSSQVDKGKSDNLSGNFLGENFWGENFF